MSIRRYSGLVFTTGAILLGGYGLMVLVTPTEESLKSKMSAEARKKYDEQENERRAHKERVLEHIKYNMNSNRPVWDVQWDKMRDGKTASDYPAIRTVVPPPRKQEGKSKTEESNTS